jgi:hypothetical protein
MRKQGHLSPRMYDGQDDGCEARGVIHYPQTECDGCGNNCDQQGEGQQYDFVLPWHVNAVRKKLVHDEPNQYGGKRRELDGKERDIKGPAIHDLPC